MTQMSSDLRKGFSDYEKCEVAFSKKIAMMECDISKSNSINLRFLLGAMESTGKMPQDKNMQYSWEIL